MFFLLHQFSVIIIDDLNEIFLSFEDVAIQPLVSYTAMSLNSLKLNYSQQHFVSLHFFLIFLFPIGCQLLSQVRRTVPSWYAAASHTFNSKWNCNWNEIFFLIINGIQQNKICHVRAIFCCIWDLVCGVFLLFFCIYVIMNVVVDNVAGVDCKDDADADNGDIIAVCCCF